MVCNCSSFVRSSSLGIAHSKWGTEITGLLPVLVAERSKAGTEPVNFVLGQNRIDRWFLQFLYKFLLI